MKKQKKVIMITGAAKRIGKEIILRLPIEEYNFVVHFISLDFPLKEFE